MTGCGGKCSLKAPASRELVLIRKRFDAGAIRSWGLLGLDEVGALHFRDLKDCDSVKEVSIAAYGPSGEPLMGSVMIDAFLLRRKVDRDEWPDERTPTTWRPLREDAIQRTPLGGFMYSVTEPKEANLTNFGQGWKIGEDWEKGHDRPVLVVMWRALASQEPRFECEVAYYRRKLKRKR